MNEKKELQVAALENGTVQIKFLLLFLCSICKIQTVILQ